MKKPTIIILLLCCLLLTACGASQTEPEVYIGAGLVSGDTYLPLSELYHRETVLTLDRNGRGSLLLDGQGGAIKWTRDGSTLTLTGEEAELSGTVEDGAVTLTLPDGAQLVLTADGSFDLPPEPTPVPVDTDASGDFYGWWTMTEPTGQWAELANGWWDCFGSLEMRTDGTGVFTIWDENLSREDPLARLEVEAGEDGYRLTGGWFMCMDADLSFGTSEEYANYMLITGHYDGFDYEMHLRPWGQLWDDVMEVDPTAIPRAYYAWYLPLLEENSPMP